MSAATSRFSLVLHGGAGTIAPGHTDEEARYRTALLAALAKGTEVLAANGTALDAVSATVVALEDCPLFNAGHGAVFNAAGEHELDAGIMDGATLAAGAVCSVCHIRNPILAAREILRRGHTVLLGPQGAEQLARDAGLEMVAANYFSTPERHRQWLAAQTGSTPAMTLDHDTAPKPYGTVGAVALDRHGQLAAATSTGGMTNKPVGRIGDTPIVGAGVYANNRTCAVSATGTGELFIRACVAYDIHARMLYCGDDLARASTLAITESLTAIGGRGGVVAVSHNGDIAMPFNSTGMYRAWIREGESPAAAIFK